MCLSAARWSRDQGPVVWLGFLCLLVSLGTTLQVALARIGWEDNYKTVTIAVSYTDLQNMSLVPARLTELRALGVRALLFAPGLTPGELERRSPIIAEARKHGLEPVFLLRDPAKLGVTELRDYLRALARLRPRVLIFTEPDYKNYTTEQLQMLTRFIDERRPLLGLLEFAANPVATAVYRAGYQRFVRTHLIKPDELKELDPATALARWLRAVREREVRLLLVHLTDGYDPNYLQDLAIQIEHEGFRLGLIGPPRMFSPTRVALLLIALGPLALLFLGCRRAGICRSGALGRAFFVFSALLIAAGLWEAERPTRLALAWLTAVLVPLIAYLLFQRRFEGRSGSGVGAGMQALLAFSGLALLGGLWVGTLLASSPFFLKLEQFRGVKAALLLPLLLVLAAHFSEQGPGAARALLAKKPTLGELLLLVLGGGVLALALLRSDNFSLIPVGGLELRLRGLLEGVLYARPRFKEFLIGQPLLFIWAAYGQRLREWGVFFLILGLLGQVSIINSFAHLHTPLLISLLRTVNGLWLGLLFGLLALGVLRGGERLWHIWQRHET